MKTMLTVMKKKKNNIPENCLLIFEDIMLHYDGDERDIQFLNAMEEHLTQEQRFTIWGQNGACRGTGHDKERKAFAAEYNHMSLSERLDIFLNTIGSHHKAEPRNIILDEENKTITVRFACKHGQMHLAKGISTSLEAYFGGCAGGRLHELQLALGINLKIKDVDVSEVKKDIKNPAIFTFKIVG